MAYLKEKVAQVFPVYDNFTPSKASVHLRTSLHMNSAIFSHSGTDIVIDATNFSELSQGGYKMVLGDSYAGCTGKGYMEVSNISTGTYPIISFPVSVSTTATYYFYLRVRNPGGGLTIDGYINDDEDSSQNYPAVGAAWSWVRVDFNLDEGSSYKIGFQLRDAGAMVDKIVMTNIIAIPVGSGPDYSVSPYLTIHMRLFSVGGNSFPVNQYFVYDYKTTISEVVQDSWYNFNISFLHSNGVETYTDLCAIVLSASGSHNRNFIFWDLTPSSEYTFEPSLYYE